MQNVNKVLYTQDQRSDFTDSQRSVARRNIGAQVDLGWMEAGHNHSSAPNSTQYVKICEMDVDPQTSMMYSYRLSLDFVLGGTGLQAEPGEGGFFDGVFTINRDVNVYRFEGRWIGYGHDGDDSRRLLNGIRVYQRHQIEHPTASSGRPVKHIEVWAELSRHFNEYQHMTVKALVNHGNRTQRSAYGGVTYTYEKPWVFSDSLSRPTGNEPAHTDTDEITYTVSAFPARPQGYWNLVASSEAAIDTASFSTSLPGFTTTRDYSDLSTYRKHILKVYIERDTETVPGSASLTYDTDKYITCDLYDANNSDAFYKTLGQTCLASKDDALAIQWLDLSGVEGTVYSGTYGKYPLVELHGFKSSDAGAYKVKAELYVVENGDTGTVVQGY